ncbi:MFS transporter [Fischerella thermalis]|uniref:MFS transporter n=1 Tax=Fischerella thermalis TaxID=372787 RepID=UPI000C80E164|nr:MFS transporter [Fischerella thermalis]PLZ05210.1 MFS transporter [Fischerella thermalis WC1110]PLZ38195.1 MFS transporter [Fischerella thermalis WC538]PLZ40494.1 MFS transporter [Fischerella thermalis WC527]PLZ50082.1 MFS transporter [Fischerella thermalis WC441]PLZ58570.1 MFS transporter [Fischerella thermalis WC344]
MFPKLILLATLYISQFIPTTFFIQALPVFMRQQKMSLDVIGFLGLLILPSGLKFLWSPFIDRYRLGKLGHYRGWIICFQLLLISTMLVTAFIDIQDNLNALLTCMFLASLFSSSQDIATDALAVNLLEPEERGLGNAIQSGGNIFGAIIGGGVMLILLDKIGWRYSLITMSIFMLLNLVPILIYQEKSQPQLENSTFFRSYFQPFVSFLSRPKALPWLFIVLLYMMGDSVTGLMIRPLLVDRGLSLPDIGWVLGIVSYSARIVSALIAGLVIVKLGRTKSLIIFGIIAALSSLLYIIPAIGVSSLLVIYTVCIVVNATQSMAYTALLSAMMDKCEKNTAATDYTMQVSVMFLGGIAATVLSGMLASTMGYSFIFIMSAAVSLLSVFLITNKYRVSA